MDVLAEASSSSSSLSLSSPSPTREEEKREAFVPTLTVTPPPPPPPPLPPAAFARPAKPERLPEYVHSLESLSLREVTDLLPLEDPCTWCFENTTATHRFYELHASQKNTGLHVFCEACIRVHTLRMNGTVSCVLPGCKAPLEFTLTPALLTEKKPVPVLLAPPPALPPPVVAEKEFLFLAIPRDDLPSPALTSVAKKRRQRRAKNEPLPPPRRSLRLQSHK
jgi:hypothetical protein